MKKWFKKIKSSEYIKYIKGLDVWQKIIYFFLLFGVIFAFISEPAFIIIFAGFLLFLFIVYQLKNIAFINQAKGNGVIFGGRGKGKGLLLNKIINSEKKEYYCNIKYNDKTRVINIKDYINSIAPNTTHNFINNNIQIVEKKSEYEGRNVYWDDVGVYAPNFMDYELKKLYPSLSALLPINRHLYNAYMIITTQDAERPYKLLKELQTDFAIKAVRTFGFGWLWNCIPLLHWFCATKYIYYEQPKSAFNGLLPFSAKALVNETVKGLYLTAGQATKEQYEATNGVIRYGIVVQRKSKVRYDTRAFHEKVFGYKSPDNVSRPKKKPSLPLFFRRISSRKIARNALRRKKRGR